MDPDELAQIDHTHCLDCYRIDCRKRVSVYPTKCPIVSCELECGARFHACKAEEHKELCGSERVPCINHVNGCPLFMLREKLKNHLERCPASVVYCTMEWNRWPVYSHERHSRVPFLADNLHAQYGQLDVALALRDQRMLNAALKAPRSTRRVLRNNITQRFPAVPIRYPSNSNLDFISENNHVDSTEPEVSKCQNDVSDSSPCEQNLNNELLKAIPRAALTLKEALRLNLSGANMLDVDENDSDVPMEGASMDSTDTDESVSKDSNGNQAEGHGGVNGQPNGDINHSENGDLSLGAYNVKKPVNGPELSLEFNVQGENTTDDSDGLTVYPNVKVEIPQPPCPAPLLTLKESLALDLNLECITRYHAKPRSMYTFLCAQEFRRDEYSHHCKNVHGEIHGGLNGWLEQRCPLAQYGCTFSLVRLYPGTKGSKIVHNSILESFGVLPKVPSELLENSSQELSPENEIPTTLPPGKEIMSTGSKTSKSPLKFSLSNGNDSVILNGNHIKDSDLISNETNSKECEAEKETMMKPDFHALPFEVLRHVCSFLDGYSLCNVAITNHLLRDVACSILEEKGIVIHQWGKRVKEGQVHWEISHKRWIFSTAFAPVSRWGFEDYVPLGEHLKTCAFYHRSTPSQPHHLPNMKCGHHHSENFSDVMKRMYPDFEFKTTSVEGECHEHAGLC